MPRGGPQAVLFDFDGVIVDSEPLHLAAFQTVLAPEGIRLTRERYYADYLGFDDHTTIGLALRAHTGTEPPAARVAALMRAKAERFLALVREGAAILPGVAEFVRMAAERVPIAVVSGALRGEIDFVLGESGLRAAFAVVVGAEDVTESKPSPQGYLAAAQRLGDKSPAACLVIEDSLAGVEAGRRAGMRCLAVTTSHAADELTPADLVLPSLQGLTWERVTALFA